MIFFSHLTEIQAYEISVDCILPTDSTQNIEFITYKKNSAKKPTTSTLLIHKLKYLCFISLCFTKGKNKGRV